MADLVQQLRNPGTEVQLAAGAVVLVAAIVTAVVAVQARNECRQVLADLHRIPGL